MSLPSGYKQLAYIESTGTQYIDTGFKPDQDTRVITDFEITSSGETLFPFCARTAASENAFGLYRYSNNKFYAVYGTAQYTFSETDTEARHKCDFNKNVVTVNGNSHTFAGETFTAPVPLTLFARNNNGTITTYPSIKMYSCQIYDNGTLIRDYVPARYSDGTAGLYDVVNDKFYTNAGTGTFAVGNDIIVPDIGGLSAPSDFTASSAIDSITLSWGAVDKAVGYILRRDGLRIADTVETEYTDNTAKPYRIYTYAVSAHDEENEGEAATLRASVVAPEGISLIDYRTASDVARVNELRKKLIAGTATEAERNEWLDGMLGAYNTVDMNRVESAVEFIRDYLNGLQAALDAYRAERKVAADAMWVVPWDAVDLVVKKDWAIEDIPTDTDLARYLSNVDILTNTISIVKNLPDSMAYLDFIGANEIERALIREHDVATAYEANAKRLIDNTSAVFIYSGEFYGGEI